MQPVLKNGALILIRKVAIEALRSGDIIMYRSAACNYVHRFLYSRSGPDGEIELITKADNYLEIDAPVKAVDFVGMVTGTIIEGYQRSFETWNWRVAARCIGAMGQIEVKFIKVVWACKKHIWAERPVTPWLKALVLNIFKIPRRLFLYFIAGCRS